MLGQKLLAATAALPQWNIARAVYSQSLSVLAEAPNVQDLHFKPDGTRLYVVCRDTDRVHEYALSTAWDISTASYTTAFQITQDNAPTGLTFKPDGTKLYVVGQSNRQVYEYNLSTPWSVSTASYVQSVFLSGIVSPTALQFKPDGTRMYVLQNNVSFRYMYAISLSVAWDISTADFGNMSSANTAEFPIDGLYFKADGTRFYVANSSALRQYNVTTPWNISTFSLSRSVAIGGIETNNTGIYFSPDGSKMYTCGIQNDAVHQFNLL